MFATRIERVFNISFVKLKKRIVSINKPSSF